MYFFIVHHKITRNNKSQELSVSNHINKLSWYLFFPFYLGITFLYFAVVFDV